MWTTRTIFEGHLSYVGVDVSMVVAWHKLDYGQLHEFTFSHVPVSCSLLAEFFRSLIARL